MPLRKLVLFAIVMLGSGCVHHRRPAVWDPVPQPVTASAAVPPPPLRPDGCPVLDATFADGVLDDLYSAVPQDARGQAPGEIDLKGVLHLTRDRARGDHAEIFWGGFSYPFQGYPEPPKTALAAEIRGLKEKGDKPSASFSAAKRLYDAMVAASESQEYAMGLRISRKSTNRGAVVCERTFWDSPYGRQEYRCFLYGLMGGTSGIGRCPDA
jgi:hypothetical protein